MATQTSSAHVSGPLSPEDVVKRDDVHKRRRRFIGPVPASAFDMDSKRPRNRKHKHSILGQSDHSQESGSSDDDDDSSSLSEVIHHHALEFFLRHGGQQEDWGESQQKSVRKEMRKRWRQSDWARARKEQKQAGSSHKWVGTSFDVGVFLGVDTMDENLPSSSQLNPPSTSSPAPVVDPTADGVSPSTRPETFITAPAEIPTSKPPSPLSPAPSREQDASADSVTALVPSTSRQGEEPADPLADEEASAETVPSSLPPPQPNGTSHSGPSFLPVSGKGKGKAVRVHYGDSPAPPSEVLERTGSAINVTSAGAAERTTCEARAKKGDVIMRDRMMVRVSYTEYSVPTPFDETRNRVARHLDNEGWAEYIVAWRKDRLELYTEHRMFGRAWFADSKRLAYIAPLGSPSTRLSLYSYVDMSFCITCPPTLLRPDSARVRMFHGERGTHIFVFKVKCRSRAMDWMWQLWRHKGGQLPPFIEIKNPAVDTRMRVDVPGFDTVDIDAAYKVFQKGNIVRLCQRYIRSAPEYRALLDHELGAGAKFELAWRLNTELDWVWQDTDLQDNARQWAVLCGLALKQGDKPARLEFRLKRHFPTRLYLKDGTRLDEPAAVEGYVDRIRLNPQLRHSVYLVTHDGYLFSLLPAHAHPPHPPGAPTASPSASQSTLDAAGLVESAETRRKAELRRGRAQVLQATGMFDLRSIVAIRRAFQHIPQDTEPSAVPQGTDWEDGAAFWEQVERSESDDEDAGGEIGMAKTTDKAHLRLRRSFELVLVTGRVLRFEAYSCATALEWIVRLRQLVSYWKKRHQADARLEMKIAHASTGRERITPHRPREDHQHSPGHTHDAPPELLHEREAAMPDLSTFYNWCVLEGCRVMLKCGRLYSRKGWWGQYSHVQLVLLSGHLVEFDISPHHSMHHRRGKSINLVDAYVCSGYFAAQYLPAGQYDANAPPVARRYGDGLETDDSEEDTMFIVWYRNVTGEAEGVHRIITAMDIPPLKAKRKVKVFRTRSKLERDAWVWAINVEIEKVVRASKGREEALRQAGKLCYL